VVLFRSIVFFAGFVLITLLFGLTLAIGGWIMPLSWKEGFSNTWSMTTLWWLRATCRLDYQVEGQENLPKNAAIVMAKHQSTWETIALRHIVGGRQSWVLKRELMWVPVFGWALATMFPIAIDRKAGRKAVRQVIDQGTEYLERGHHIIIFPEGTRTAPGTKGRYGVGGALLAQHTGAPVIPIAHNAGIFWRRRGLRKLPGTIQLVIGPGISTEGRKAQAIIRDVETWIEATMENLPQKP